MNLDCVERLNLVVSSMNGSMVINTLVNGLVTTMMVCLNCPLKIYGKEFWINLICFPLS